MKKLKEINSPYLTGALIGLIIVSVLLLSSPYTDVMSVVIYIIIIIGALYVSNRFSKKQYVLTRAQSLNKRVMVYAGLSLFIGVLSVAFSAPSNPSGFTLDFTLYVIYRSLFYALILFVYYYIDNEKKLPF